MKQKLEAALKEIIKLSGQEYQDLVAKRQAETLTPDEHAHLIWLSDQLEIANAQRIQALVELAQSHNQTLAEVMAQLGQESPGYI